MAKVRRLGPGAYRVEHDGRIEIVYVAGGRGDAWAFWNGELFHEAAAPEHSERGRPHGPRMLSSPMPATIIKVVGAPGIAFKRGDTLVVVEAMKMELPIAAEHDGIVKAVHCREGDLVQAGQTLIELE
jgi:biotin carboxyl carrier protein